MTESSGSVGIVGAGAVARAFGLAIQARGEPVVALASRTAARAEEAAKVVGPKVRAMRIEELPTMVDRVIIAVSDDAIESVARTLSTSGMRCGIALHTSGATGLSVLEPLAAIGVACGIAHPMQTIVASDRLLTTFTGVPFGVAGAPLATAWATRLITLAGGRVLHVDPSQMAIYHAGAVMASNAIVAVVDAAIALLGKAGIPSHAALDAVSPICRTTIENLLAAGPRAACTGPVARGDVSTVKAHLDALTVAAPELLDLYRAVSRRVNALVRGAGPAHSAIDALTGQHCGE